ncbi:tyrosine-type recombinase/integrase [Methylomagnum sp.]
MNAHPPTLPDLHELALLRGWIRGLPFLTLAELYLPGAPPSEAKHRVEALIETLSSRARRAARPDLADALTGERRASEPWQRAAERAIEAITRLPEPHPGLADPVDRWLPPRVALPLSRAGLGTLGSVSKAGTVADWWRDVPRLGEAGADLVRQLFTDSPDLEPLQEAEVLGPPPTGMTPREPSSDLAPLECFRLPPGLDGRDRANRAPPGHLRIVAATDDEAVRSWLAQWPTDGATWRAYRREAERCLLWSVLERRKSLSALTVDDAVAYRAFLRDPQPRTRWVGPLASRNSPDWRPFQDGLSERSAHHAETVLRGLFGWLREVGYLAWSPYAGLRRARRQEELGVGKALSERELAWLFRFVESRLDTDAAARHARFALRLAYATGLRISNLAAATLGDLERREGRDGAGPQWWLHARVKGDKPHRVPITALIPELRDYLAARGHEAPLEGLDPDLPLIGKRRRVRTARGYREEPYSPSGLHDLLKSFFEAAGAALAIDDPLGGERLRRATTHALRHTHATHALARGVPVGVAQRNLGHASLAVTSQYITVDEDQRHAEMGKLLE